jgi:hypothetical protein
MNKDYIPKKGDKFNAIQKEGNAFDKSNPQICLKKHDIFVTAIDGNGNERFFRFADWRFEKI